MKLAIFLLLIATLIVLSHLRPTSPDRLSGDPSLPV
jgi:hypothetical protein